MNRPIVLIGPMGVGKTTIGKKLARMLAVEFVDTDQLIISEHGPIEEIFQVSGEEHFRDLETRALVSALDQGGVVSTGGGAILREDNRKIISFGLVVYLETDGKHIASRIQNGKRPLLQNGIEDWNRIYDQRRSAYEAAAELTVDTSGKPLGQIVDEILNYLEGK
jgi:shikimate kinase